MKLNRMMKRAAVAAARQLPRADPSHRRIVLCYHSVHPNRPYVSTTPELFECHIAWLRENCQITSLADIATRQPGHSTRPTVAITFDDGYEDNHSHALPILMRHAVPATFFITAGFVDRDPTVLRRFHHFLSSRDDEVIPLDWAQVRELRGAGMAIGSHTYSHPNLARLSSLELANELRVSKSLISSHLGEDVDLFAYPFGKPKVHFTAETVSAVRAAGYRVAAAVIYRGVRASDSLLRIPRLFADGDTLDKLRAKVTGDYDLVSRWQEHAPLWLMRAVSPDDFSR